MRKTHLAFGSTRHKEVAIWCIANTVDKATVILQATNNKKSMNECRTISYLIHGNEYK